MNKLNKLVSSMFEAPYVPYKSANISSNEKRQEYMQVQIHKENCQCTLVADTIPAEKEKCNSAA